MSFETRFLSRFSDDQLGILWRFSGLGELTGDPEAPYPGRRELAKFLQPIPGSWRDILRRAVRTAVNRRELAALVEGILVTIYVPPDCNVVLRGERVKLRMVQPRDRVRVTYTELADSLVAREIEVRPAYPPASLSQ